jgi:hypothetical protein
VHNIIGRVIKREIYRDRTGERVISEYHLRSVERKRVREVSIIDWQYSKVKSLKRGESIEKS